MKETIAKSHASRADRPTSFDIHKIPTPGGREEDWRFTPMRRIESLFDEATYKGEAAVSVTAPQTVRVQTANKEDSRVGAVLAPGDRTAVVSWHTTESATVVEIPPEADVLEPVMIDVQASSETQSSYLVIRSGANSRAKVLLRHFGPAKLNQTVEIRADDGAHLAVVATQEWDPDALHASNHRLSVGKDASIEHTVVTIGGDLVRICVDTEYTGSGGSLKLNGLYFVDAGQHLEHRIFVDHQQPACYSRVTYKGALQGKDAHAVWIGDCLIGENADATDTYELNRNLILTEGAKADSVPNLEIENGDIEGAGHASATGRFDDEQLFYLMSRGISEIEARRLVVRGFFAELLDRIGMPKISEELLAQIELRLDESAASVDHPESARSRSKE